MQASLYPGQRYEVESRYTQFVNLHSRPVTARLDLGPLAELLNVVDVGREAGTHWAAPRYVDTGPLLRLDRWVNMYKCGGSQVGAAELLMCKVHTMLQAPAQFVKGGMSRKVWYI